MPTATHPPVTPKDVARARAFGLKLPTPTPTAPAPAAPPADPRPRTCRLTLTVAGQDYRVRPLANDAFAGSGRAWRLRKLDGSGTAYDVVETIHGAECDCPDWIFHRDGLDPKGCKHIKSMRALGLIG